jgi:mono/diheme cytochrome c family protein
MNNHKNIFIAPVLILSTIALIMCSNPGKENKTELLVAETIPNDTAHIRQLTSIKYEPTAERLVRGKYLVSGILQCLTCHSQRNWDLPGAPPIEGTEGSGGTILNQDSTTLVIAPNITPDKETGAGTWTDDMLARSIREGVGHDGRVLDWRMPSSTFRDLSDDDLASVIVYLRSMPAVKHVVPPSKMPDEVRKEIGKYLRPITRPIPSPDLSDSIALGRYLVKIGECVGCHTAHSEYNPGLLGGGNYIDRFGQKAYSANVTTDASGIGYGQKAFLFVIRTGKGGTLSPIMPWIAYKNMNDADIKAIYAYLATFPTAQHAITNQQPFTHCDICGMDHGLGEMNRRQKPVGIKLNSELYKKYAGTYFCEKYNASYVITQVDNKLFGQQWENGPKIELIPQTSAHFLAPGWALPVSFIKGENDRVISLKEDSDFGETFTKIK